jgi:hypothetical protein
VDSLKQKFGAVQQQMAARLAEIRATHEHKGNRGTGVEESVRDFLRTYLPRRLGVGHGEVIDAKVGRSSQTDVVIVSEDHPFSFNEKEPGLFFVEGVYAAGEVKTRLTTAELNDSLEKALRFRMLQAAESEGAMTAANEQDIDRYFRHPPYFIFAFESDVPLASIRERAIAFDAQHPTAAGRSADAIFLLDRGWVIHFGTGAGSMQFRDADGKSHAGWNSKESPTVLFDFLWWLSTAPPRVIRFAPILLSYKPWNNAT